jgi:hypothetical protein
MFQSNHRSSGFSRAPRDGYDSQIFRATEVAFQVPVMEGPPREFRLVLHDGGMRVVATGERVSTERRRNLDIPPPHGR